MKRKRTLKRKIKKKKDFLTWMKKQEKPEKIEIDLYSDDSFHLKRDKYKVGYSGKDIITGLSLINFPILRRKRK